MTSLCSTTGKLHNPVFMIRIYNFVHRMKNSVQTTLYLILA